jgi:hypothetical protein
MCLHLDRAICIITVSPVGCDCEIWVEAGRALYIGSVRNFPQGGLSYY